MASTKPAAPVTARTAAFATVLTLSVIVGLASLRILAGDPRLVGEDVRASMIANGWVFILHAGAAAVALGVGGFQFLSGLRRRWPRLHRWTGRTYVLGCVLGALSALWIAPECGRASCTDSGCAKVYILGLA